MKECWSDGELRAHLDGELAAADAERLSAHLEQCTRCAGRASLLAQRAAQVASVMAELAEPEPAWYRPPAEVVRNANRRPVLLAWAAAALAAGVALGILVTPKRTQKAAVIAPAPPPAVEDVKAPPVEAAIELPAHPKPPAAVPAPRHNRKTPAPREYFLALDDEPVETGMVMRVGTADSRVQADILLGPDGRAHAIRLVNDKRRY